MKTYQGSCHCGKVRFEADMDVSAGTGKCNCSICTKTRFWGVMVKPEQFRAIAGADNLADYQFGTKSVHHYFCKTCGVRPYGKGFIEEIGGAFYTVNLMAIDGVDFREFAEAPLRVSDGRNNNWQNVPDYSAHL